jgi:two-component system sensor histidine kinase BaeS
MRLRLVHTLSLLLMSAVLLAVLVMGGLMAWGLRAGFAEYLADRDVARLEQFAAMVSARAERAGGLYELQDDGTRTRDLLHEFARRQDVNAPRDGMAPPFDGHAPGEEPDRPPRRDDPPPPGPPDAFGRRVALYGLDGRPILGRPLPREMQGPFIERPIHVHGKVEGWARMLPLKAGADELDARFLHRQYMNIAWVAGALCALAVVCACWVARRWVRPLVAVRHAVARIARGEMDVRLPPGGIGEIGDVVSNVNRMAEGLQRLEGSRRRWIADISHELRTPLAVLRGELEALADGVRPLRREAVLSLQEEVARLGGLVNDLHLLAMSDLKALPCQFESCNADQVLMRVMQRYEHRAREKGLALRHNIQPDDALPVRWDAARIEQLVVNLLENSLRYTDAPGQVQVSIKRVGKRIELDIDDSAPGVPRADLPRVFEPLYRADAARSRHNGGSGLGLAICEAIVRAHGGRIAAIQSELGGLRVHVDVPVHAGAGV